MLASSAFDTNFFSFVLKGFAVVITEGVHPGPRPPAKIGFDGPLPRARCQSMEDDTRPVAALQPGCPKSAPALPASAVPANLLDPVMVFDRTVFNRTAPNPDICFKS